MRFHTRAQFVYAALLASALGWLGLIFAAPWLMAEHHYTSGLLVYGSFAAICHQMPERSFHWLGYPLAVCARCLGIYAGFLLGLAAYPLARRLDEETIPARWWLLAASAPMAADFAGGATGLFTNTGVSRAATGMLAGAAVAFYILPGLVAVFRDRALSFKLKV